MTGNALIMWKIAEVCYILNKQRLFYSAADFDAAGRRMDFRNSLRRKYSYYIRRDEIWNEPELKISVLMTRRGIAWNSPWMN
jgi:hypothetical protein